jgi:hypothetical protein
MLHLHERPVVGTWYWDVEHSLQFEIVATDLRSDGDGSGTIEIQYFDGEVEELDLDTWYSMRVVSISAPKDWTGPYEVEKDEYSDLTDGEAQHPVSDWNSPLDNVE